MQTVTRQQGSTAGAAAVDFRAEQSGASQAEWLSAFLDGEADDAPHALLAQPDGKAAWDTYHLIGDVLRSPRTAVSLSPDFAARVSAAIAQEPAIVAAPRRAGMQRRKLVRRYGLPGLAAAAAVASVTWMAQPYFSPGPGSATTLAGAVPAGQVVAQPVADRLPSGVQLGEYLEAHRQFSGLGSVRQVSVGVGSAEQR